MPQAGLQLYPQFNAGLPPGLAKKMQPGAASIPLTPGAALSGPTAGSASTPAAPAGLTPTPSAPAAAPSQTQQNQPAQTAPLPAVSIPSNLLPGGGGFTAGSIQQHYQSYATWAQTQGYTPMPFDQWSKLSAKFGGVQPAQGGGGGGTPPPPGGGGGGGPPPPAGGDPFTPQPNQPGVLPNAPLRPDVNPFAFPDLIGMISQAFGGLLPGGAATTGQDPNFRGNLLNVLGGPFANAPFGLPGRESDAAAGFLMNMLFNEVAKQQPRAEEREGLLRSVMERLGQGPESLLNQQNIGAAGALTAPGALDALTAQRRSDLDQSLAGAENAAMNRLRESGVLGQGRSAATPMAALQAQLANTRRRGLLDISEQEERDRLSRLGLSTQVAGAGTDITRALQQDPVNALITTLGQAQNPAVGAAADFLNQIIGLTAGQALSSRGGSFFEQISPLLGAGIGAVGQIAGAPSTTLNLGGGGGSAMSGLVAKILGGGG